MNYGSWMGFSCSGGGGEKTAALMQSNETARKTLIRGNMNEVFIVLEAVQAVNVVSFLF